MFPGGQNAPVENHLNRTWCRHGEEMQATLMYWPRFLQKTSPAIPASWLCYTALKSPWNLPEWKLSKYVLRYVHKRTTSLREAAEGSWCKYEADCEMEWWQLNWIYPRVRVAPDIKQASLKCFYNGVQKFTFIVEH